MSKTYRVILLFALFAFLPFLSINSAKASEIAYFTESSEYEVQITQNDSAIMEQYKENYYAFNADINFEKYETNTDLETIFDDLPLSSVNNLTLKEIEYLDKSIKVMEIKTTASTNVIVYPNNRNLREEDVSLSAIILTNSSITTGNYFIQFISSYSGTSSNLYFGMTRYNETHSYMTISNQTETITYSDKFNMHHGFPLKFSLIYSNTTSKLNATVISLYDNSSISHVINSYVGLLENAYFVFRTFRTSSILQTNYLLAIDSNRILVENTSLVGIYSQTVDVSYTDDRILELYNTQNQSYGCADRMHTVYTDDAYHFPFQEPSNDYFTIDYDRGTYNPLNPSNPFERDYILTQELVPTQDIFTEYFDTYDNAIGYGHYMYTNLTEAYKPRYRDVSAINVNMTEDYSIMTFDPVDTITDVEGALFSIVFSVSTLTEYLGFYWVMNELDSYCLEIAEDTLKFSTFYIDTGEVPPYILNYTIEEWDITNYLNQDIGFYLSFSDRTGDESINYGVRLGNERIISLSELTEYNNGTVDYEFGSTFTFFYGDLAISDGLVISSGKTANCLIKGLTVKDDYEIVNYDIGGGIFINIYPYLPYPNDYISNHFSVIEIFDLNYNRYIPISYNISVIRIYNFNMSVLYQNDTENYTNQEFTVYSDILTFTVSNLTNPWEFYTDYGYTFLGEDYLLPIKFDINTDLTEFSYLWEVSFVSRWVLIYEFADNGWFVIFAHAISPISILVVFAIAGYQFLKFKGTVIGLILGFIVLYFMNMLAGIETLIILVVILLVAFIYHIRKKGGDITV